MFQILVVLYCLSSSVTLSIPLVSTDKSTFLPHELRVPDATLPLSDSIEEVLASRSSVLAMYFSIVAVDVRLTRAKRLKEILEAEAGAGWVMLKKTSKSIISTSYISTSSCRNVIVVRIP